MWDFIENCNSINYEPPDNKSVTSKDYVDLDIEKLFAIFETTSDTNVNLWTGIQKQFILPENVSLKLDNELYNTNIGAFFCNGFSRYWPNKLTALQENAKLPLVQKLRLEFGYYYMTLPPLVRGRVKTNSIY